MARGREVLDDGLNFNKRNILFKWEIGKHFKKKQSKIEQVTEIYMWKQQFPEIPKPRHILCEQLRQWE